MNSLISLLTADRSCENVLPRLQQLLTNSGLRFMQTFDLRDTKLRIADCPCPHHGTDECDCQMIVLLVYSETIEPATLVLHGHDGQTCISLANSLSQRTDPALRASIMQALQTIPEK